MDSANDDHPHRRRLYGQEKLASIPLDDLALTLEQTVLQVLGQRVASNLCLPDEALLTRHHIGHEDSGAPGSALFVEI
jgi:hypothetical protein